MVPTWMPTYERRSHAGSRRVQVERGADRGVGEAGVRRQRDRHVEVEDPLREALVGVVGHPPEDERDRDRDQDGRREDREGGRRARASFGDEVVEDAPGQHREEGTIEGEKAQRTQRSGIPVDGRQGGGHGPRSRAGSRAAGTAPAAAPRAGAWPGPGPRRRRRRWRGRCRPARSRRRSAAGRDPRSARKKSQKSGTAKISTTAQERQLREHLAEPDRGAVDGRQQQRVERGLLGVRGERAVEGQHAPSARSTTQSMPAAARGSEPRSPPRAKWTMHERRDDELQHPEHDLAPAHLEQQVGAGEDERVRDHASAPPASVTTRPASAERSRRRAS